MSVQSVTVDDLQAAERVIRDHVSPAPLIRSFGLEKLLGLASGRRIWLKDYGWTPSGSFKLLGALNWMANNLERISGSPSARLIRRATSPREDRIPPAYASKRRDRRPATGDRTTGQVRAYAVIWRGNSHVQYRSRSSDRRTGSLDARDRRKEKLIQASPYDDSHVVAGNGVVAPRRSSATWNARHALSRISSVPSAAGD